MLNFILSGVGNNVMEALGSMNLWNAVAKSVLIIILGYVLTKGKFLPENTSKVLTKVVLTICLPCLAFSAFMTSITVEMFKSCIVSFIYGFIVYVLFIFLAKLLFAWEKNKTKRQVLEILFVFGSTTFFGQPLIQAVFGSAFNDSNMFNVAYRVFLYSYAYYAICQSNVEEGTVVEKPTVKDVLKKIFYNPIVIATLAGFVLWSLQLLGNSKDPSNWWVVTVNKQVGAFWNISVSLPPIQATLKALGGLCSPLVWIAIGCKLASVPFKEAASDKKVWIFSFMKLICAPVINLGLLALINLIPGIDVTFNTVAATTLMWATPPATVAVTYCMVSNKEATFASSCSLVCTLVAVIFIPIYIVLLTVIQSAGFFH